MRTQAIEDCRYCPNPSRVAATSGALTLHVAALMALMIPISAVQIPKLVSKPPDPPIDARIIEREQPKPQLAVVMPKPKPIKQPVERVIVPDVPIVIERGREMDQLMDPPKVPDVIADASSQIDSVVSATVPLRPVHMPKPVYPRAEQARGIQGEALVRVRVGLDGAPVQIRLERSSGNANLDRAALDAARKWRFEPAVQNGTTVEVEATVPVRFSLLSG